MTTLQPLVPSEEQEAVIQSLLSDTSRGALIASDMGTGKTLVSVEFLRRLGAKRILIACPKSTFGFSRETRKEGWIGTLDRQGVNHSVTVVRSRSDVTNADGVFLIGREYLSLIQKDTKSESGVDWRKVRPFDLFIFDEVHFICQRSTNAFATACHVPANRRLALSGTPFRTKFDGLWAVCRWVWHGQDSVVPRSYWSWRYKWCSEEDIYVGGRKISRVTGERNPGEFVQTLPCYHRIVSESRVVSTSRYVELTPKQRSAYTQMERNAVTWLQHHETNQDAPLVASLPVVQRIRLREMTLGLPNVEYFEALDSHGDEVIKSTISFDPECSSAKLDALAELLRDYEGQVLVGTHSQKFAEVAAERIGAALWTGRQSESERAEAKRAFLAGERRVLVATPRSFGTGTDGLQEVCNMLVFLSRDDSDTDNLQFIARLDRMGQPEPVVSVVDIVALDTFDEGDLSMEAVAVLGMHASLND